MILPYVVILVLITISTGVKIGKSTKYRSDAKVTNQHTCNKQYLITTEKVTFNDAVLLCLQYGMEIASPINAAEEAALIKELNAQNPSRVTDIAGQSNQGIFAQFIKWCFNKGIRDFTSENALVSYLEELSKTKRPSVVKEVYLFIRNALLTTTGVDISKYAGVNKILTQIYNFDDGIWIGSTRLGLREFIWINTGFPVEYTNFLQGDPGNGTNNCLGLVYENQNKFGWHTYQCETKLVYACQTRCC